MGASLNILPNQTPLKYLKNQLSWAISTLFQALHTNILTVIVLQTLYNQKIHVILLHHVLSLGLKNIRVVILNKTAICPSNLASTV